MNGALLGAKFAPAPTDQAVVPPVGLPDSSTQSNAAPPHAWTSMPRWALYQAPRAAGSAALKKIPPMPVTRFMSAPRRDARLLYRDLTTDRVMNLAGLGSSSPPFVSTNPAAALFRRCPGSRNSEQRDGSEDRLAGRPVVLVPAFKFGF